MSNSFKQKEIFPVNSPERVFVKATLWKSYITEDKRNRNRLTRTGLKTDAGISGCYH